MMKKFFSVSVGFLLLFLTSAVFASLPPAQELSQLLKSFDTYFADFTQVTLSEAGKVLQTSKGRMWIKRPGKFRWESKSPTDQVLMTNGQILWTYDVDLAQVTKQKLSDRTAIDPATLLSGSIANLTENFNISTSESKGSVIFVLTPKKSDLGFSAISLTFSNKQLVGMKVVNSLDQTTLFNFNSIKLNTPMPETLFNFKPQPGVDVISQ